jgi:hypothetical protein
MRFGGTPGCGAWRAGDIWFSDTYDDRIVRYRIID